MVGFEVHQAFEVDRVDRGDIRVRFDPDRKYAYPVQDAVFDLIVTFLLIWSVAFDGLSTNATVWLLIFLGIMLLGVVYSLKKEENIWI